MNCTISGRLVRQIFFKNVRSIMPMKTFESRGSRWPALHTSQGVLWRRYTNLTPNVKAVTTLTMKQFLNEHSIGFLEGYTCFVLECQFCKAKGYDRGQASRLYINMTTGFFTCLKCQNTGTWQDFQDIILLAKRDKSVFKSLIKQSVVWPNQDELKSLADMYDSAVAVTSRLDPPFQAIFDNFSIKEIKYEILEKYGARLLPDKSELLLPIYSYNGLLVGLYSLTATKEMSSLKSQIIPRSLKDALFGFQRVNPRQDTIVITGSPLDTLTLAQECRVNVVSLPQAKSLPLELLPLFEPFKKVILWMDSDVSTWHLTRAFARKLNEKRCYVIRPMNECFTPLENVKKKNDLHDILKSAQPVAHRSITTFHSLRQDVFLELSNSEQIAGVKWKRFPFLNKLLKGHRHGELTIFTGSTGSGKTTFMSEYSLDLCIQGVRTLWGSFEIKNTRLAKIMMLQYAQCSMDKFLEEYNLWADKFESLPLFFLTFHGPESVKNVLDAMRHAVYIHDIEHIVVDNLQFMLGTSEASNYNDRFWKQDLVISSFRQFATVYNCHVTLVIHPRKEDSDELNNMSIFGGAKATQEADNVLILQNKMLSTLRGKKYIQITKNRFDGELGIFPLDFDGETRSFALKKEKKPKKVDG